MVSVIHPIEVKDGPSDVCSKSEPEFGKNLLVSFMHATMNSESI